MSYILDALRRVERDQRPRGVPGVMSGATMPAEVSALRAWFWPILGGVAVLVNAVLLTVLLWPAPPIAQQDPPADSPSAPQASATTPAPLASPSAPPTSSTTPPAAPTLASPPAPSAVSPALGAASEATPPASAAAPSLPPPRPAESVRAPAVAAPPASGPANRTSPAVAAAPPTSPAPKAAPDVPSAGGSGSRPAAPRGMIEGKPLKPPDAEVPDTVRVSPSPPAPRTAPAETALSRGLPSGAPRLKLEVLVYAETPGDRFVFINGRKYQEGQSVEEGVTLERINQDGATLTWAGQRFTLRE